MIRGLNSSFLLLILQRNLSSDFLFFGRKCCYFAELFRKYLDQNTEYYLIMSYFAKCRFILKQILTDHEHRRWMDEIERILLALLSNCTIYEEYK